MPAARRHRNWPACSLPVHGPDQALQRWPRFAWPPSAPLDDILQHLLVEAEVRHQAFEPDVFLFKLLQALHLRRHQSAILASPSAVRLDRDPCLAADLLDRCSILRLLQYEGDLLLTKTLLLHPETPSFGNCQT